MPIPAGPRAGRTLSLGLVAVRVLMLADTHVPRRARDLPAPVWAAVDAADVVIHAGDWVDVALLDALEARAARLIGVYGNNDGPPLRARLPEVAEAELGGVRVAVVHETGPAAGREQRCAARYPGRDLLVFGHSHIPWDTVAPNGLRLLNPGSPTDRRRQPHRTYLTATLAGGEITAVTLHRLT
jgi:putative phosphoesterase